LSILVHYLKESLSSFRNGLLHLPVTLQGDIFVVAVRYIHGVLRVQVHLVDDGNEYRLFYACEDDATGTISSPSTSRAQPCSKSRLAARSRTLSEEQQSISGLVKVANDSSFDLSASPSRLVAEQTPWIWIESMRIGCRYEQLNAIRSCMLLDRPWVIQNDVT
jgi:hypothetical protein